MDKKERMQAITNATQDLLLRLVDPEPQSMSGVSALASALQLALVEAQADLMLSEVLTAVASAEVLMEYKEIKAIQAQIKKKIKSSRRPLARH